MNIVIINEKNRHRNLEGDVYYVGRPSRFGPPSPLCNKFSHLDLGHTVKVATVEEAVACYRDWLHDKLAERDIEVRRELNAIYNSALKRTVYLKCWCMDEIKPWRNDHACHAEVIREVVLRRHEELSRR